MFAKYIPVRLNFELLPFLESVSQSTTESSKLMPVDKRLAPKRLALNIENGNRLIFTGSAKPLLALFDLMRNSSRKLILSLQPEKPESEADFPHYNLMQTMATGETLVWQNEAKKTP